MSNLSFVQLQKGNDAHYDLLASLMLPYNKELDGHRDRATPGDLILKITRGMLNMQGPFDRHLELCLDGNDLVGFLYGKVDHVGHKGFIKPEYGYIMEFYVKPEHRRKGYGKVMYERLERLFASHGAGRMYLTADPVTGEPFWKAMGFEKTGETSPENGLSILEKDVSLNAGIKYLQLYGYDNELLEKAKSACLPSPYSAIPAAESEARFVGLFYKQNIEILHGGEIGIDEWETALVSADADEWNFLVCRGSEPVAWLKLNGLQGTDMAWISMLAVSVKHQRQGAGRYAVNFAEEYIRAKGFSKVGIHTTDDNAPARELDKKCGYAITGHGEYTTGDGAKRTGCTFEKTI